MQKEVVSLFILGTIALVGLLFLFWQPALTGLAHRSVTPITSTQCQVELAALQSATKTHILLFENIKKLSEKINELIQQLKNTPATLPDEKTQNPDYATLQAKLASLQNKLQQLQGSELPKLKQKIETLKTKLGKCQIQQAQRTFSLS